MWLYIYSRHWRYVWGLGGTPSSRITYALSQNFRVYIYICPASMAYVFVIVPQGTHWLVNIHATVLYLPMQRLTILSITSIHTYIDQQIQHSSNWHWLWREAGDGCPILTDIQFSTRLASDCDRVVTLRNTLQVGALTESIWCQYNGIQYNVMEFYELCTKVCILGN